MNVAMRIGTTPEHGSDKVQRRRHAAGVRIYRARAHL